MEEDLLVMRYGLNKTKGVLKSCYEALVQCGRGTGAWGVALAVTAAVSGGGRGGGGGAAAVDVSITWCTAGSGGQC